MYVKINMALGGSAWGEVIASDIDGRFPYLVSTEFGIMQRGGDGFYFPV